MRRGDHLHTLGIARQVIIAVGGLHISMQIRDVCTHIPSHTCPNYWT